MNWRANCAAVIPCLNEERAIEALVSAVRCQVPTVIVVDDGSRDATAACAARAGAMVLSHPVNLGKGAALLTGWRHAAERGFKWALSVDGDGQHSADDIPRFFQRAEDSGAAVVVGNRMDDPARMPWLRRATNRWMSARLSRVAGQPLADSQCGFRLINLAALGHLRLTTEHFEIESEVLLAFSRAGHRIEFVPIQSLYKQEQSKIHPLKDTLRWLRWWRATRRFGALPAETAKDAIRVSLRQR